VSNGWNWKWMKENKESVLRFGNYQKKIWRWEVCLQWSASQFLFPKQKKKRKWEVSWCNNSCKLRQITYFFKLKIFPFLFVFFYLAFSMSFTVLSVCLRHFSLQDFRISSKERVHSANQSRFFSYFFWAWKNFLILKKRKIKVFSF